MAAKQKISTTTRLDAANEHCEVQQDAGFMISSLELWIIHTAFF
jgi:hypothetical protein